MTMRNGNCHLYNRKMMSMALPLCLMMIMLLLSCITAPCSAHYNDDEQLVERRLATTTPIRHIASDAPSNAPSPLGGAPHSRANHSTSTPTSIGTLAPFAPIFATSVPTPIVFPTKNSSKPSIVIVRNSTNSTKPSAPQHAPTKPTLKPTTHKPVSTLRPSDIPSAVPTMTPSLAPSNQPTNKPTALKSNKPTKSPTSTPTKLPSLAPTLIKNASIVTGQVNVVLSPVSRVMDSATLKVFVETTTAFFNATLNSTLKDLQVSAITQYYQSATTTTRSRRHHRYRQLATGGSVIVPLAVLASASSANAASSLNLNTTLAAAVKQDGSKLVKSLQASKNSYLKAVQTVSSTASLPPAPTPVPNGLTSPTNPPSTKKKGLGTGVIIGIAVAGAVLLLIVVIIVLIRRRTNSTLNRNTSDNVTFASMPMTVGDDHNNNDRRKSSQVPPPPPPPQYYDAQPPSYSSQPSASQPSRARRSTAAASQSSMADTHSDYGSELMGTDNHSDRGDNTAGGDTMSYTYSLDAGLTDTFEGNSIISGTVSGAHNAPVPTSIPHITKSSRDQGDDDDDDGLGMLDDDDDLELDLGSVASSILVGATGGSARVAEQYITRECWAPPGKLGIVIDTTLEGPVVHKVNPGSPLEGMVWPGDIIIAIDNVDTRAMSASAITQLMIKTAKQRRKLTILSDATK